MNIGPDQALSPILEKLPVVRYVGFDLTRAADVRGDLIQVPFRAGSFDLVICSHVLEHVSDDLAAMRSISACLAEGGDALILVPIDDRLQKTDEDPSVIDPAERRRRFGQSDHVRRYGQDFGARLRAAGLGYEEVDYSRVLSAEEQRLFGLSHRLGAGGDRIYRCERA